MKKVVVITSAMALLFSSLSNAAEIAIQRFAKIEKRGPASIETISKESAKDQLSMFLNAEGFFRLNRYQTKAAKFSSKVIVFDQGSIIPSHKLVFAFNAGDFDGGVFVFEPTNFTVSEVKTLSNGKYLIKGSHFDEDDGKIKGTSACYTATLEKSVDGLVPAKMNVNSSACPKK